MAFVIPTFNLEAGLWTRATPPPAARRHSVPCQLRAPTSAAGSLAAGNLGAITGMILLLPLNTDIRDPRNVPTNNSDIVEVPLHSGRFYDVIVQDDVARGFPNEHRFAILMKSATIPWPTPSL